MRYYLIVIRAVYMRFLLICVGLFMACAQGSQLITPASKWQYYDKREAPEADWFQRQHDHQSWPSGTGQFGYGENDETTVTSFGQDADNKPTTQYYVRSFKIDDIAVIHQPKLRLLIDDGAVVYLNGLEVFRLHLGKNSNHQTLANDSSIEGVWIEHELDKSLLHTGSNFIAVEVHQLTKHSSDLSFDLALTYTRVRGATEAESVANVQLSAGQPVRLSVTQAKSFSAQYVVTLGEGVKSLDIAASGGSGDADLYVNFDQPANLSDWQHRSRQPGNGESVSYQSPPAGRYYITLFSYRPFVDVELMVHQPP
ncbi:MAG: PPC domain-containing protein [Psychrosphaera sp.]|nr:PPC domain-containing protein [Psychrosphaera sp.]